MNKRGWVVVLIWMALVLGVSKARSADSPRLPAGLPAGVTCNDIRSHVQKYGYWPALLWAKANGFTAEQITEARRCLRRSSG